MPPRSQFGAKPGVLGHEVTVNIVYWIYSDALQNCSLPQSPVLCPLVSLTLLLERGSAEIDYTENILIAKQEEFE